MSKRKFGRFVWLALFIALGVGTGVIAQESRNQAAVVISLDDGQVLTRCVAFEEENISGYELLSRTGLALEADITGMGVSVCQIQGSGCPINDCFCQCKGGGTCLYWSYWHLRDGAWQYAQGGASVYQVGDGDVDGWVWGVGAPNEAPEPPDIGFAEICRPEPSDSTSAEPGGVASGSERSIEGVVESGSQAARPADLSEMAGNDSEVVPAPSVSRSRSWGWSPGGLLSLIILGVVAVFIVVRRRKEVA